MQQLDTQPVSTRLSAVVSRRLELAGRRVGCLKVHRFVAIRSGKSWWQVRCLRCRRQFEAVGFAILHAAKRGQLKGCNRSCARRKHHLLFSAVGTREFWIWHGMMARCENPKNPGWKNYGGRGIRVCNRWRKFSNFLSDMGQCPEGKSLGRSDNNGPYSPLNCRWESRAEQANNSRRNRWIRFRGKIKTEAQWARCLGMSRQSLSSRLQHGWTVKRALSTPLAPRAKDDSSLT